MGENAIAVYDPSLKGGGVTPDQIDRTKVLLSRGFYRVHTAFTVKHIRDARKRLPDAKAIVHPEIAKKAAWLADARGSTSQIIKHVEAPPGARPWLPALK